MARYKFGGTLFDFVDSSTKIQNIDVLAPTAATVSLWTDKTGGTQITDLQDSSGSPITTVSVQSDGNIPDFFGPDGVTSMYASADGGPRLAIVSWHAAADAVSSAEAAANSASSSETSAASSATAAQTAAQQAQAPTDSMVANLLQTPSSATATAANSAITDQAVGRTVRTKHAPALGLYFPEAEGAVGDGVADDTAAVQAALDAAAAGKGTLSLDAKTHKITATLGFSSFCRILGQNFGGQLATNGSKFLWAGAAGGTVMAPKTPASNTVNVRIDSLWINGGTTAAVGLSLYRTSYGDFRGVYVDGMRSTDGVGFLLDGNVTGQCYFNVFTGCKASTSFVGARFQNGANANQWIGGKLGDCSTGLQLLSASAGNTFVGLDMEANSVQHVYVDASANVFLGTHMEDSPIGFNLTANGWDTRRFGTTIASSVTTPLQDASVDGGGALDRIAIDTVALRLATTKITSRNLGSGTTVTADPMTVLPTGTVLWNYFRNVNTSGSVKAVWYKGDGTGTPAVQIDAGNLNLVMRDMGAAGGQGVIALRDRLTVPSATPSGGGIVYSESGALRYKTSGGATLTVGGDILAVSANTAITVATPTVLATGGAGGITVTLPPLLKGSRFTIKKVDSGAGAVTVATNGVGQTIDGAATKVLAAQYDKVTVVCDGAAWYVV